MCVLCDIKLGFVVSMAAVDSLRASDKSNLIGAVLAAAAGQAMMQQAPVSSGSDFNAFMRTTGECLGEIAADFFKELETAFIKDGEDEGLDLRAAQQVMLRATVGAIYVTAYRFHAAFKADKAMFTARAALWIAPYFAHVPEITFRQALRWEDKLPRLQDVGIDLEQTDAVRKALILTGAVGDLLSAGPK